MRRVCVESVRLCIDLTQLGWKRDLQFIDTTFIFKSSYQGNQRPESASHAAAKSFYNTRKPALNKKINTEQVEWKSGVWIIPHIAAKYLSIEGCSYKTCFLCPPSHLQNLVFTLGLDVSGTAPIMDEFLFSSLSSSCSPRLSRWLRHYLMHFSRAALLLINTWGWRPEPAGGRPRTRTCAFVSYFIRIDWLSVSPSRLSADICL